MQFTVCEESGWKPLSVILELQSREDAGLICWLLKPGGAANPVIQSLVMRLSAAIKCYDELQKRGIEL